MTTLTDPTADWFRNFTPPTESEKQWIRDQLLRDMMLDRQRVANPLPRAKTAKTYTISGYVAEVIVYPRTCLAPGCVASLDHRRPQTLTCSGACRVRLCRALKRNA